MKQKLLALLIPFFALVGCDKVKIDDKGQQIDKFFCDYSIKVSSNTDKLYFCADEGDSFAKIGAAKLYKPGLFTNSAHFDFGSYEDIGKPEFWYYQIENGENAQKFVLDSFVHEDPTITYYFLQKIEFNVKIEEEEEHEYDISVESITFPQVNVYSLIFAGNCGYQERLSDGDQIGGDQLISHLKSNELSKVTFYMYLNGNDPLVTNENIQYIEDNAKGLFDIRLNVVQK